MLRHRETVEMIGAGEMEGRGNRGRDIFTGDERGCRDSGRVRETESRGNRVER